MHIKDHSAAMKFFRTYDSAASKGKWKDFVDEMEFESMIQKPRAMAQEPRMGLYKGKLVTQGKRKGQWVVSGVPMSEAGPSRTLRFPSEEKANEWISTRPGKGRKDFGKHVTGEIHKGKIRPENQKRLDKLIEIINDSNNSYTKTLTSKDVLIKAGWKGGWQGVGTTQAIRPAIVKELSKLNNTFQKMDNYVNNVMLADDALMKDFRNPMKHLQKKFGVSATITTQWKNGNKRGWNGSQVVKENKALFDGLAKDLSFNKYKLLPDGTPRLMSDYSFIQQKKMPSKTGWFGMDSATQFILNSAERNYLQMKAAGKTPKVTFITDPAITNTRDWQFIDNETDRLFSVDPSIDTVEFRGKSYKNNFLQHQDARKLYKKEFGNLYKKYDVDLAKYLDATVIKDGKSIKLDRRLQEQAYESTGKRDYFRRRMMEVDHADLWGDPFGRKKGGLRLMDRIANQQAGILKRLEKYKNNPKLLKLKLDESGYNRKFNNTDELIEFYSKKASPKSFAETIRPKGKGPQLSMGFGALDDLVKSEGFKKGWRGFRKVGGPWEVGFIGLDFMNNLDNGMDTDTAFQTALSNATLGMYEGGKRAQWKDFETAGKELGHNPENLNEIKSIMDLEKMLTGEKQVLSEMIAYNAQEGTGEGLKGEFSAEEIEWRKDVVARLEKEFENKQNTFWSKDNAQDLAKNYQDTVGYVARKEYNKNLETGLLDKGRKDRVNPEMGSIGSALWETIADWKDYAPQSLLPQNFLQNEITKAIPNTLRKLPGIFGDMWEPTSEQAKFFDMSEEEKAQRAKDLNIQEQYYHPVTGNTMTQAQMEPYEERYYAEGGIASLMKKW